MVVRSRGGRESTASDAFGTGGELREGRVEDGQRNGAWITPRKYSLKGSMGTCGDGPAPIRSHEFLPALEHLGPAGKFEKLPHPIYANMSFEGHITYVGGQEEGSRAFGSARKPGVSQVLALGSIPVQTYLGLWLTFSGPLHFPLLLPLLLLCARVCVCVWGGVVGEGARLWQR